MPIPEPSEVDRVIEGRADALLDELVQRAIAHRARCQNQLAMKCTGEEVDQAIFDLPRVTAKTLLRLAIWRIVVLETLDAMRLEVRKEQ